MPQNTELERSFFQAVKRGELSTVKELVTQSKELLKAFDYDEFGGPCLNLAGGHRGNLEMITLLLDLGADVNQRSDWWPGPWSPALLALNYKDNAISEYLVERGAQVDAHLAAGLGRIEDLTAILDGDPDQISARGGDGCFPLHFAGSEEVVDLLIDRGADMEARDIDHHSTPVQWISHRIPKAAQRLFERGAEADIFSAVVSGAELTVRELIEKHPDVLQWKMNQKFFPPGPEHDVHNILTFWIGAEATPMHAAAVGNQPAMIRLLTEGGLNVDAKGAYDDCTALHLAAWNDQVEVATALLDAGAAIEQESGELHQNTPMGWAIVAGSIGVAELLLRRGCEIRDYYLRDTKHGAEGGFLEVKCTELSNYDRISKLLQS